MNKEIYLVRGTEQESYRDFNGRIFNMVSILAKRAKS